MVGMKTEEKLFKFNIKETFHIETISQLFSQKIIQAARQFMASLMNRHRIALPQTYKKGIGITVYNPKAGYPQPKISV